MPDSATPRTAAYQAPPSLGFSRQEHWSGLPFPSPMHESEKWKWSRSVTSDSLQPHGLQPSRLFRPWEFPGKSTTGVGCHCPLRNLAYMQGKNQPDNNKINLKVFCHSSSSEKSTCSWLSDLQRNLTSNQSILISVRSVLLRYIGHNINKSFIIRWKHSSFP